MELKTKCIQITVCMKVTPIYENIYNLAFIIQFCEVFTKQKILLYMIMSALDVSILVDQWIKCFY